MAHVFRGRRSEGLSARDTVFLQVALSTSAGRGWSFVARTSLVAVDAPIACGSKNVHFFTAASDFFFTAAG